MTDTERIHELTRGWEDNYFTFGEFQDLMTGQLQRLPAPERQDALETLSAHANEDIRKVAAELRLLQHNEALSKDIDYVQRISPLQPGSRLELFGGYDDYSSDGKAAWLNGRDCYRATFLRFASYENTIPTALVEFDEIVEGPGCKGRYGVLFAGHGSDSIAWGETEGVVSIYVNETLPEDVTLIRLFRNFGSAAETHASYRVEQAAC